MVAGELSGDGGNFRRNSSARSFPNNQGDAISTMKADASAPRMRYFTPASSEASRPRWKLVRT